MKFTDIFIQRPVLASVISLLILVLGLRSITSLELRQYPETENTVVTITTSYPGADSELIKGFITTPLQQAISEADGIDYLSSTSRQGTSTIVKDYQTAAPMQNHRWSGVLTCRCQIIVEGRNRGVV